MGLLSIMRQNRWTRMEEGVGFKMFKKILESLTKWNGRQFFVDVTSDINEIICGKIIIGTDYIPRTRDGYICALYNLGLLERCQLPPEFSSPADEEVIVHTDRILKILELTEWREPTDHPTTDVWWSFECFNCLHEIGGAGCIFDVRLPVKIELPTAKCPRCGTVCDKPQSWGASESGHGSRGDGGLVERVRELEASIKSNKQEKKC